MARERPIILTGEIVADIFDGRPKKGDIVAVPRLDKAGRKALAGSHTNYGYSGHWLGYLWHRRARRKIVNWRELFPNEENCYGTQAAKGSALGNVAALVEALKGFPAIRVKGGYEILAEHDV